MRWRIKSRKIIETVFNLRTICDSKPKLGENRRRVLNDARKRMLRAKPPPAAGQRQISLNSLFRALRTALSLKSRLNLSLPQLYSLAELRMYRAADSKRNGVVGSTGRNIPDTPNTNDRLPNRINRYFTVQYSLFRTRR